MSGRERTLNDSDRAEWVNNDEGLYNWWRGSRQPMRTFIKEHRAELDAAINRALGRRPNPGDVHVDISSHNANPGVRQIGRHVSDFASAEAFLGGKHEKKLANNTWVIRETPDTLGVRLHNTTVVAYHRDGRIVVRSGGYQTVTTKQRINQLLPPGASIYQERRVWYWSFARSSGPARTEFHDGDVIASDYGQWAVVERASSGFHRRNPGKFDSDLDQWCYQLSLEGVETMGDVQTNGHHYSKLSDIEFPELVRAAEDVGDDEHTVRRELHRHGMTGWRWLGAIVEEDDQGFVSVSYFKSNAALDKYWAEVETQLAEDEGEEEEE